MCIYPQLTKCEICPFKRECGSVIRKQKQNNLIKDKVISGTKESDGKLSDIQLAFKKALQK